MDNTELDLLLRETAPQPPLPDGLAAHREKILAGAKMRRTRRVRMWTASTAVAAVILGGGSAAMAGSGMETPWGWVADNVFSVSNGAEICFAGYTVSFVGVDADSSIVQDARAFVGSLDLDTLDTTQMEAALREANLAAVDENGDRKPIAQNDAELKQMAVWRVASEMMWKHLASKGYETDPNGIGFNMATDGCDL